MNIKFYKMLKYSSMYKDDADQEENADINIVLKLLGLPSAPTLSTCLMHPTWAGDRFHP